jgi:recombination protein RecT
MAAKSTRAVVAKAPSELQTFIEGFAPEITAALDGVLKSPKFIQVAVNAIAGNPDLEKSTPHSIIQSLLTAAEVGLFPGSAHGYAYLVPYYSNKEKSFVCTYMLGYRGILALCHRSKEILKVEAHTVHQGDEFEISYGLDGKLWHKPEPWGERDMKTLVGAYAIAYMQNGTTIFETLNKGELAALRKRSKGKGSSPWDTDTLAMCTKSAVRKLARWLPLEPKDQAAINQEERGDIVDETGPREVSDENASLRDRLRPVKTVEPEPDLVQEMDQLLDRDPDATTDAENDSDGWVPSE